MPRQTSMQLTEATERQIEALKALGYGTLTDIVRIAVDRMYTQEVQTMQQPYTAIVCKDGETIWDAAARRGFARPRYQIVLPGDKDAAGPVVGHVSPRQGERFLIVDTQPE